MHSKTVLLLSAGTIIGASALVVPTDAPMVTVASQTREGSMKDLKPVGCVICMPRVQVQRPALVVILLTPQRMARKDFTVHGPRLAQTWVGDQTTVTVSFAATETARCLEARSDANIMIPDEIRDLIKNANEEDLKALADTFEDEDGFPDWYQKLPESQKTMYLKKSDGIGAGSVTVGGARSGFVGGAGSVSVGAAMSLVTIAACIFLL